MLKVEPLISPEKEKEKLSLLFQNTVIYALCKGRALYTSDAQKIFQYSL